MLDTLEMSTKVGSGELGVPGARCKLHLAPGGFLLEFGGLGDRVGRRSRSVQHPLFLKAKDSAGHFNPPQPDKMSERTVTELYCVINFVLVPGTLNLQLHMIFLGNLRNFL